MDKKLIIARIDELMLEKGKSKYDLKENSEVSSTIYQWRKNAKRDATRTPSLRSIEKICEYLDVSLAYFFSFNIEEQIDVKCNEIINSLSKLNSEQLKIIEKIIKQFEKVKKD